jgi:hypothetical protein
MAIFWRLRSSRLEALFATSNIGFKEDSGVFIPQEYLDKKEFIIMRTCHGLGDWGIISAMPKLLKKKYPDCKVYIPSEKLLIDIYGQMKSAWDSWTDPFKNAELIFRKNPYVDGEIDEITGDVYHDHYRIIKNNDDETPLVTRMLKYWRFTTEECEDNLPELFFTDEEKEEGEKIIKQYVPNGGKFGCLLLSKTYIETKAKTDKLVEKLKEFPVPYFLFLYKDITDTPFDFIQKIKFDFKNLSMRVQLYIKTKATLNIGDTTGTNQLVSPYSPTYLVPQPAWFGKEPFSLGECEISSVKRLW